jgi:N-acetylglucosaminyl-diphospho-decaprenol L-rhamnosyltransferase
MPEARALDIVVVIVSYRSAPLTIESLRSVAAEHRAGLKIRAVVVDNASDDLPEIARAVADNGWTDWVTLLAAPKNGGFAYGNNLGIQRAYADAAPSYVYLLNPDTRVHRDAIASLVRFMESHRDVGIAGSSFETGEGADWPIAFRFPSLLGELEHGLQLGIASRLLSRWVIARRMTGIPQPVDWICGASMMIRPEVLAATGGMDENYFLYYEEVDFCYRARQAGFSTWYVPESRVMHIGGQSTQVTTAAARSRRLPAYWFESRRRYFAVTVGIHQAMAIDLVAVFAFSLGRLKRLLLLRRQNANPCFIRDLIRHSVLWPSNRAFPAVRGFFPQS